MIETGELFAGRFRILTHEGGGGTAEVFRAFDDEEKMQVALKVFKRESLDPDILSEIWNRESLALSKLRHPSIVRLIDAGRSEPTGLRYIAVEWIDGHSLNEELKRHAPMSFDRFMQQYGNAILDALIFAASEGVNHRDLSPWNILVVPSGELKIIDFGQAKIGEKIVGLTVGGFASPPYCPPEIDTRRYTATRDAYSFSAIVIRAISGAEIRDHEELYLAFGAIDRQLNGYDALEKALAKDPDLRPSDVTEFDRLLRGRRESEGLPDRFVLYLRFSPELHDELWKTGGEVQNGRRLVLTELNETASISHAYDPAKRTRFILETRSYRVIADLDSFSQCCLVLIGLKRRAGGFAQLWRPNTWQPEIKFIEKVPVSDQEKDAARGELIRFYDAYEDVVSEQEAEGDRTYVKTFDAWTHLLDAMTDVERNRIPRVNYRKPELEENRLRVELDSPGDAEIGQQRVILNGGRVVFSGEIEELSGNVCTLLSTRTPLDIETIPRRGQLEADWKMTRVSIQRQRSAVDRFRDRAVPNARLVEYVTFQDKGANQPSYSRTLSFFNRELDQDKKTVVSRFMAMDDLLLVQGPPGTGKTTLIVEMIQQYLRAHPDRRILLVSQTHVALDHAISGVLHRDEDIGVVRIGSGVKDLGEEVQSCSIEKKGDALIQKVTRQAEDYIKRSADVVGENVNDVQLGIRLTEVLRAQGAVNTTRTMVEKLRIKLREIENQLQQAKEGETSTIDIDALDAELKTTDERIGEQEDKLRLEEAVLQEALRKLRNTGADGKQLASQECGVLEEWRNTLLEGPHAKRIMRLMEAAEEWRLKFGHSDDLNAAIIAGASIVAGTCVGFCREAAAASSRFDLCIVDEASKSTTPELLVPLSQAKEVVLLGDHHQLPAVMDYALQSPEIMEEYNLSEGQLESQLFESLHEFLGAGQKAVLTTQFRMRPEIGSLISRCFYDGILSNAPETEERVLIDLALAGLAHPVTWLDTSATKRPRRGQRRKGTSFVNPVEVDCILGLLRRIAFVISGKGAAGIAVGVISSYSEQVLFLRSEIAKCAELDILDVECSTVHQFQGKEVDVCIYSVTRDNESGDIGFLTEWRHLNVALSRGRDYLVIVGARKFCMSVTGENPFYNLIAHIESLGEGRFVEYNDAED